MIPIPYNTLMILLGTSLLGGLAGMVGCFAVLRQRSLTGDALAHASLPGICLAFLIFKERSMPMLLAGALASGLLGVTVISVLRRWTRIKEDAAIGIVLSVFFGAGLVLLNIVQKLDGDKAGLASYIFGDAERIIAKDVYIISAVALVCLVAILLLFKEFQLVAFDPEFGKGGGWPILGLDLFLMFLIAVTVVIGLPSVGVVMIAALLIIPAAAARFWTERLSTMLLLSAGFGVAIGVVGTFLSAHVSRMPAGPIIVLVGAAIFLVSMLFAPRRGTLAKLLAQRRFQTRFAEQGLLRTFFEVLEQSGHSRPVSFDEIQRRKGWSSFYLRHLMTRAESAGWIAAIAGNYQLTASGRQRAERIARNASHLESLLNENIELAKTIVDLESEVFDSLREGEIVRINGQLPVADTTDAVSQIIQSGEIKLKSISNDVDLRGRIA